MIPIVPGTASRLGLRKPPLPPPRSWRVNVRFDDERQRRGFVAFYERKGYLVEPVSQSGAVVDFLVVPGR